MLMSEYKVLPPRHFFNPLTPQSDWCLISPYHITTVSNISVMRIKEMITN